MARYSSAIFPVRQFLDWDEKEQLHLQPKFQRRKVWPPEARSYFIDTLVRGMPVPKVYLRKIIHPKTKLAAYEVVDGQQRLSAVLDFCKGKLSLRAKHNDNFPNATLDDLPQTTRANFLNYALSTEIMEAAGDSEVWEMFERLNTFTLTLNRQEKLNARFFGEFKRTAYKLAADESSIETWKTLRVFTNHQIARMKEVELTSDVLAAFLEGIDDIKRLPEIYKKYDDKLPKADKMTEAFTRALEYLRENLADPIRRTRFRSRPRFYSLLIAVIDTEVGIPNGKGTASRQPASEISDRMDVLDLELRKEDVRPELARLDTALSRGTSLKPEREIRHDFFHAMLSESPRAWRRRIGIKGD